MSEYRDATPGGLRETWRRILALSWPVMAEQTTRTLMRTTDVFITALFSPAAVVAIGLADLYTQFPLRIGLGLGGGAIALSSQDTGRQAATRDEAITQALVLGALLGVPIAFIGYLFGGWLIAILGASPAVVALGGTYLAIILATAPARHVGLIASASLQGTGDTRTPMYVNVLANVLNIAGSATLGLGLFGAPELRVVGVGIATAAANVVMATLLLAALWRQWTPAGFARPRNPTIARQLLVVGIPRTAEGFSVVIARFLFNALLLRFGTEVNAGFHIGRRIYQQVTAPLARGYNVGASVLVGQALGRGDNEGARSVGWAVASLGVVTVGTIGVGLFLAAEPIARLFTDDPAALQQSIGFVRAYGIEATPMVIFLALSGSLAGAGETRLPFVARSIGVFVFMLGFAYVAGLLLGYGALAAYVGIVLSPVWMALSVGWGFAHGRWAGRAAEMMAERDASGE